MESAFPFTCPHCGAHQFIAFHKGYNVELEYRDLPISGSAFLQGRGKLTLSTPCIGTKTSVSVCSICHRPAIRVELVLKSRDSYANLSGGKTKVSEGAIVSTYFDGLIYPTALTPVIPKAVPGSLVNDYQEAWAIAFLSPKASAVLARRRVQGAIRDFCGVSRQTLNAEIEELRRRYEDQQLGDLAPYISRELLDLIDNIRSVGNIGAHMEKNVNKIIPVDSGEAELLLKLVGMLFTDWYQARGERRDRLDELTNVVAAKAAAKKCPRM